MHEDEALAYKLQKQEVEQHYGNNKQRNTLVREDFPKAKEEQEKEIVEAAEKHRQMVRQQEKIDSTYARRVAEKFERDEFERRKRAEVLDQEVAKKMQAYEVIRNVNANVDHRLSLNSSRSILPPDVNKVGLPLVENVNFETVGRHQTNIAVTHSLRNLRLNNDNENYETETVESVESYPIEFVGNFRTNRTPTPATLLPEDVNEIITDVDLQEEANRRLQEEKDAELARILQKQEEEILNEEIDRDRLMAIEAQDKELAKLLYEKEKAKVRRAKERARQRALQKKQAESNESVNNVSTTENSTATCSTNSTDETTSFINTEQRLNVGDSHSIDEIEEYRTNGNQNFRSATLCSGRTSTPVINVAMHIDPTYLSQQSSSMPNSLIFQDGDCTAPPYMPIQGQRRNPSSLEKKTKKSKSKDGCKQQ